MWVTEPEKGELFSKEPPCLLNFSKVIQETDQMTADRPNALEDLWDGWEDKTLEQKQRAIHLALHREAKVLFSRQDQENLFQKSLEVGKVMNLHPEPAIITPSDKYLREHDPQYSRRQRAYAKARATGENLDPEFDPWAKSYKE